MAIVKMKKLTAIVLKSDTEPLLRALHKAGAIELEQVPYDEEGQQPYALVESEAELNRLESELADLRIAIGSLAKHDPRKKPGFFTPRPATTVRDLDGCAEKSEEIAAKIANVKRIEDSLTAIRQKQARVSTQVAQLEPFMPMSAPVENLGKRRYVRTVCGFIQGASIPEVKALADSYEGLAYAEPFSGGEGQQLIPMAFIAEESIADEAVSKLKELAFSEVRFEGFSGTCKDRIAELNAELETMKAEQEAAEKEAVDATADLPLLNFYEDHLTNEIQRESQKLKLGETRNVNVLTGWIRGYDEERVRKVFETVAPTSCVTTEDASMEEDSFAPTCVETNKVCRQFQAVTEMYDTPSHREMDPSAILSIPYFIVFGMMLSDAAYGILLSIFMGVTLMVKKPPKGSMSRKVMGTLMICGISTLFWGSFFGSWFGQELIPAWGFIPTEGDGPMSMLILCLGFGMVHLIYSYIMGVIISLRRKNYMEAIFDKGLWLLFLLDLTVLAAGMMCGFDVLMPCLYVMIAIAVGLLFTQGRSSKSIIGKVVGGLGSLYDVTGVISDILSYARIFGMSLATGVIAQVFNTLGAMFFGNIFGYVIGAVIMVFGNTFNLAINVLGSFVHSCRLQYIESFPKYFDGGGRMWKPLAYRLNNYRFED